MRGFVDKVRFEAKHVSTKTKLRKRVKPNIFISYESRNYACMSCFSKATLICFVWLTKKWYLFMLCCG